MTTSTTCTICGCRLLDIEGRGIHPSCDHTSDPWWTPEQQAEWLTQHRPGAHT